MLTCITTRACITHVPWCMPGSLTCGFLWSRWRGKRSWHSRCIRNPQFYVCEMRLMVYHAWNSSVIMDTRIIFFTPLENLRSFIHERLCRIMWRITQISLSLSNCRVSHWKYQYIPERSGPITYEHITYKHHIIYNAIQKLLGITKSMTPFDYIFTYHAE